jgi:Xaa-Pro aminopeptidase
VFTVALPSSDNQRAPWTWLSTARHGRFRRARHLFSREVGVRIEDIVRVTADGAKPARPHELIVLTLLA